MIKNDHDSDTRARTTLWSASLLGLTMSAALAASATACASSVKNDSESTRSTSSAVWGGSVDAANPANDIVVHITSSDGGCTGTLISPRLVLTAAHCIQNMSTQWRVDVGVDQQVPLTTRYSIRTWRNVGLDYGFSTHSPGQDLAILALDKPIVDEVRIPRPKFGGGAGRPAGFAGYSPYERDHSANPTSARYRTAVSLGSLDGLGYGADDNNGGFHWFRQSESAGIQHGDSGGPLFYVDADGTRQVVGVASQMACKSAFGCDSDTEADRFYWAAVTYDNPVSAWIIDTARESAHPDVIAPHGNNWLARHGRTATSAWLGEVDYTGPCDVGNDRDCDHWYDWHDNCEDVPNPGQEDVNDVGMPGDACWQTPPMPTGCSTTMVGCYFRQTLVYFQCAQNDRYPYASVYLDLKKGAFYDRVSEAYTVDGLHVAAGEPDGFPAHRKYRICIKSWRGPEACSQDFALDLEDTLCPPVSPSPGGVPDLPACLKTRPTTCDELSTDAP